jgi:2-keto-4-pentenoate hydratase/2-oxohepta-3-ene-1,7-dioic acid hydratase in catechol pathway
LGVVIGKDGRDILASKAEDYVAGKYNTFSVIIAYVNSNSI